MVVECVNGNFGVGGVVGNWQFFRDGVAGYVPRDSVADAEHYVKPQAPTASIISLNFDATFS